MCLEWIQLFALPFSLWPQFNVVLCWFQPMPLIDFRSQSVPSRPLAALNAWSSSCWAGSGDLIGHLQFERTVKGQPSNWNSVPQRKQMATDSRITIRGNPSRPFVFLSTTSRWTEIDTESDTRLELICKRTIWRPNLKLTAIVARDKSLWTDRQTEMTRQWFVCPIVEIN